MIELGDEVEDIITGFKGTALAKIKYINGCIQFQVQPNVGKDGTQTKHDWIDHSQLKIIKKQKNKISKPPLEGGIRNHPE